MKRYKILLQDYLKLDIVYEAYEELDADKVEPANFATRIRSTNCRGGAISKDIKNGIIPFLDEIDPLAHEVQSVNTVIRRDDKLYGYNTDASGFQEAIMGGMSKHGITIKTAVVYGYGGVSGVAFAVLRKLGADVYVTGRRLEQAAKIGEAYGVKVFEVGSFEPDLVVNATPASDAPLEEAANLLPCLKDAKMVFDHQMPGPFLKEWCAEHAVPHISGYDMYYPQMAMQWGLFLEGLVDAAELPALLDKADRAAKSEA